MSYAASEDGSRLFMITRADTKKFRNLSMNRNVSALIDTRTAGDRNLSSAIRALTISGKIAIITDDVLKLQARQRLFHRHPDLEDFFGNQDPILLNLEIESVQVFEGLEQIE
jgi:general stress protein 26